MDRLVETSKRATANLVEDIDAFQVLRRLAETGGHGFLSSSEAHTGIIVLLVGLVSSLGISNLALQVVVVFGLVLTNTVPESPLKGEEANELEGLYGIKTKAPDSHHNNIPECPCQCSS